MGCRTSGDSRYEGTVHPKKLIVAAGLCATEEGPPPQSLALAWRCHEYHALPEIGGLRDQLAGEVERMSALNNVYRAVRSWYQMFWGGQGDIKIWLKYHKHDWKIVQEWRKMKDGV